MRQMRDQGVKAVLMGGDGITSDEFATVGGPGVEGTLMTFAPDPRKRAGSQGVVEKFRAKKFEPEAYTLYSYAAVRSSSRRRKPAKSLDPKKVADADQVRQEVQDRDRRYLLRQEGRHHPPRLRDVRLEEERAGKITYVEIDDARVRDRPRSIASSWTSRAPAPSRGGRFAFPIHN